MGSGWSQSDFPNCDSETTWVLVFGGSEDTALRTPLEDLAKAYPHSHILGCSTSGEILGTSLKDDSLVVAVCRFEGTRLKTVSAPIRSVADSFEVGKTVANELVAPDLRGVFVLSDGLMINGSELVNGLNCTLPSTVVVTGGLAGDGSRFQRTWVQCGRLRSSGQISAIGFYGSRVTIGHGFKGGWDVFGPERLVTRSSGNILFELDGKSALSLYKLYLGDLARGLPANAMLFPLSLRRGQAANSQLVRTILSIDEKEDSMTFAGDIPQGCYARLMKANLDRLIDGAMEAAQLARIESSTDSLAIAISCVGRRLVLHGRAEEEVESVKDILSNVTKLIGFYSYGEISPHAGGRCELHNQTMTLTTIGER
jgi:hypothetical protein